MLRYLPFFRAFVPVEASLLAFTAALVDAITADETGSRVLLSALVVFGVITAVGHLTAIVVSQRLR
jgi:hypothetical protein